jgi:hypothetical protein
MNSTASWQQRKWLCGEVISLACSYSFDIAELFVFTKSRKRSAAFTVPPQASGATMKKPRRRRRGADQTLIK